MQVRVRVRVRVQPPDEQRLHRSLRCQSSHCLPPSVASPATHGGAWCDVMPPPPPPPAPAPAHADYALRTGAFDHTGRAPKDPGGCKDACWGGEGPAYACVLRCISPALARSLSLSPSVCACSSAAAVEAKAAAQQRYDTARGGRPERLATGVQMRGAAAPSSRCAASLSAVHPSGRWRRCAGLYFPLMLPPDTAPWYLRTAVLLLYCRQ